MYFDLNVPVPPPASLPQTHGQTSKKNKRKQTAGQAREQNVPAVVYSSAQIAKLEARIDLLVRLGYTIIAFNQTVVSKVDPRSHVNWLDPLLKQLRKREGVLYLKRLTIELYEESDKGNGLSTGNTSLFTPYDILALLPTTQTTLSSACLTHSQPSPLTTHIISLPLTEQPRLPFRLKHTLVRTAVKNGAVFEINYAGTLHGGGGGGGGLGGGTGREEERRNWWAAAREVVHVTKGKGLIVSGGVPWDNDQSLRAPRDIGNLITLLGLAQNLAHDAATTTPKLLLLRAQTRKTYRAVLSEPTLIMPSGQPSAPVREEADDSTAAATQSVKDSENQQNYKAVSQDTSESVTEKAPGSEATRLKQKSDLDPEIRETARSNGTKRPIGAILDENGTETTTTTTATTIKEATGAGDGNGGGPERKKKKKKRAKVAAAED